MAAIFAAEPVLNVPNICLPRFLAGIVIAVIAAGAEAQDTAAEKLASDMAKISPYTQQQNLQNYTSFDDPRTQGQIFDPMPYAPGGMYDPYNGMFNDQPTSALSNSASKKTKADPFHPAQKSSAGNRLIGTLGTNACNSQTGMSSQGGMGSYAGQSGNTMGTYGATPQMGQIGQMGMSSGANRGSSFGNQGGGRSGGFGTMGSQSSATQPMSGSCNNGPSGSSMSSSRSRLGDKSSMNSSTASGKWGGSSR